MSADDITHWFYVDVKMHGDRIDPVAPHRPKPKGKKISLLIPPFWSGHKGKSETNVTLSQPIPNPLDIPKGYHSQWFGKPQRNLGGSDSTEIHFLC